MICSVAVRVYEATFIFKTEADSVDRGQQLVKEMFTQSGGTFLNEEDIGEQALAYVVKKADRGHYYRYEVETEPTAIRDAERALRLAPEILKHLIVRKDS